MEDKLDSVTQPVTINSNGPVKMWEQEIDIPTYPTGQPDKNPMFLEKRVYQGSSGRVYPHPVIDKIHDEKIMKRYKMVFLENEYLQIWIMPELGGRIQRALDKTNQTDFVYYNQVIKPALVGLAGPWISGGIEFNWPQHHRPNTFGPVEYTLKENDDGSKTVWVGEIDRMYRTKVTTGFTLHPGKAYLQIDAQLYNGTCEPQTFLWWANPAVAVNDHTQSVFPPDVHAVLDHGKRDVSAFPIARGTYYKVDYSAGVDISRYRNIPVPTSYMAYRSDFNFVGGYDHQKKAGLLHIADHHVSPGKKQWTWGNGDFGQAWDRNLTDEDGPYIELMTGVYTDNQPDFTWLHPYEEKSFTQYFMPYKGAGVVKNATTEAAVNLEITKGQAVLTVYATALYEGAEIELTGKSRGYLKTAATLSPKHLYSTEVELDAEERDTDLLLTVRDARGRELVSYRPLEEKEERIPEPAKAIPAPELLENNEALFLAGMHLEQYRHATYEPDGYYLEGLKRDPGDMRINNAYGRLLFRRGRFAESEPFFRKAVETASRHNTNLYDGEPLYNLGLCLNMQGRRREAYEAFYKACWSSNVQEAAYFHLALLDSASGNYTGALAHGEKALIRNARNYKARNLKTAMLRKLGMTEAAEQFAEETLGLDIMDFGARYELHLLARAAGEAEQAGRLLNGLVELLQGQEKNYIELSLEYANAGLPDEALEVLNGFVGMQSPGAAGPMPLYYLGWISTRAGKPEQGVEYCRRAAMASPDYCFPNRLEDILVLRNAVECNPGDARAWYYLGNLWYDRKQADEAIFCWEKSRELDGSFPTVHRNLALAYYNKRKDPMAAGDSLEKAFALNPGDARVFLELDQLRKKLGALPAERLESFRQHRQLVELRDDLTVEFITLLNLAGDHEAAKDLALNRMFHPWEGGEGKITAQYVQANLGLGKRNLAEGRYEKALEVLTDCLTYPQNLGEGKLFGAQENDKQYYLGCAWKGLGDGDKAREHFLVASVGLEEPASAMFYNDQPPEMIYYQGKALRELGETEKAAARFNKLLTYGRAHLEDRVSIDYFAVSLPDFLIFDEDLNRKNRIHCHYLMGLGYLGQGLELQAAEEFNRVLELDPCHQGAITHRPGAQS